MKVAIVHDWLNHKIGGGESVLFELIEIFPQADIYSLVVDKKITHDKLRGRTVRNSFLQLLPRFIRVRPRLLLPLIKLAVNSWNFDEYDLIISSSSAWVKNIKKPEGAKHICYCHSPARMLWDSWPGYIDNMHLPKILKLLVIRWCSSLRLWDYYASDQIDLFIANSKYVAGRIKKFYGRTASVIYPPVNIAGALRNQAKLDYYLVLSVLAPYKKIDLAIKSFASNGHRLIIAGDGPDRARLEKLARGHKNISFSGRVSESEKWRLLAGASALIFPSIEDFGITPVEALASGTPVIARLGGGLMETVAEGKTGCFFDQDTSASLNQALQKLKKIKLSRRAFDESHKFDRTNFISKFKRKVREYEAKS